MASEQEKSNGQNDRSQVLEEQIDSMPIVEEDVAVSKHQNGSERHESNRTGVTKSNIPADDNTPQETSSESMPSSGIGSPSAGPGSLDSDEAEEKERLIQQVLELQNTLTDLSLRVDSVKEENLKLRSENQVLGQYIENLMSASNVFQSTSPSKSSSAKKSAAKK